MNSLTSVFILTGHISEQIILYIFIVIAAIALLLFILNFIFSKGSNKRKKKQGLSPEQLKQKENFETQKNDIETEISLVLKIEKGKQEVKDETRELQQPNR